MRIRHILNPNGDGEFSFCGLAEDAFLSGDHPTDDEFASARPSLAVTCPDCCQAIREIRSALRGVRLTPKGEDL